MLRKDVFIIFVEGGCAAVAWIFLILAVVHSLLLLCLIIVRSIKERMESHALLKSVCKAIIQTEGMIGVYACSAVLYFASIKPFAIFAFYRTIRLIQAVFSEYANQPEKQDTKHALIFAGVCGSVFFLICLFLVP